MRQHVPSNWCRYFGDCGDNSRPAAGRLARRAAALLCAVIVVFLAGLPAFAVVVVDGNVLLMDDMGGLYYDDPSTPEDEGRIPRDGNVVEERDFRKQVTYEGRRDDPNKTPGNPDDDVNVNFHIIVGRSARGLMSISGGETGTDLRDMDLIIGDQATINGVVRRGDGVVFITGFGNLYNNDPNIIHHYFMDDPGFPDNPTSPSVNPRPLDVGYDLYVGRGGRGELNITQGGRAEIEDAVFIGDLNSPYALVKVDGPGSLLQSGGFRTGTSGDTEVHYMIVGRRGTGTMNITTGGQVVTSGPRATTAGDFVVAAVIGGYRAYENNRTPDAGGNGTVRVDGFGSAWTVGGTLQVGAFHGSRNDDSTDDLEGNQANYPANLGSGTLRVANEGLVSIIAPPTDPAGADLPDQLDLVIGKSGRVELTGGRIEILPFFNDTDPPGQELNRARVINDGTIVGFGRISTMQFRNRVLGEVRVGAGQKLLIEANGSYSETDNIPLPDEQEYPLSNYGLIEVQGTGLAPAEIEFERSGVPMPTPANFTRPFLNLPVPPPAGTNGRTGGEIVGRDAILRFKSNITNRHKVSFTGGTNLVTGNFFNEGTVFVGGDNTTVTFVDEFINSGVLHVDPNVSLVMFIDNVTLGGSGSVNTTFGGRPTGQGISRLSSAEHIELDGILNASLFTAPGVPAFAPQPGDQFTIISSATELIGDFVDVNLPGCTASLCFVGFPDYALDSYFIRAFSIAAAMGADFDGSGIVDAIDLQIWRQNIGKTGIPGTVPGDADGDGDVDGDDFFLWQMQVGGPGMGAGSGSGNFAGAVPEPASLALLASAALLTLAVERRRRRT